MRREKGRAEVRARIKSQDVFAPTRSFPAQRPEPKGHPEFPRVEYYRFLRFIGNMRNLFDLKLGAQLTRNT